MNFSVSHLKDYLWCPQYSHNLHTLHRGLDRPSTALWLGDIFHQCMAARLLGKPLPFNLLSEFLEPEVIHGFRAMLPFLTTWQVPSSWNVLQVEQALQADVGKHRLLARPDAIIRDEAGQWLVQWKTLGRSVNLGIHQERVRLSFHECGYHYAVVANAAKLGLPLNLDGPRTIAGTILGTYKKLTKSELASGLEPFSLIRLPRTWQEVVRTVDDMSRVADKMEESLGLGVHLKNLDSCYGRFGNSTCQFYQVCHGSLSLKDPPFTDLPNRYSDLEAS
jgi:hypothetical protein